MSSHGGILAKSLRKAPATKFSLISHIDFFRSVSLFMQTAVNDISSTVMDDSKLGLRKHDDTVVELEDYRS